MKKLSLALPLAAMLFLGACSSGDSGKSGERPDSEGDEQVKDPVMNSGPQTEAERAETAVADSSAGYNDSSQKAAGYARPDSLVAPVP